MSPLYHALSPRPIANEFISEFTVTFTVNGSLHLDAAVARTYFPADALVAVPRSDELWLFPLTGPEAGGLLLKQRNPSGDRATLIWEFFPERAPVGTCDARWDLDAGAVRVSIAAPAASTDPITVEHSDSGPAHHPTPVRRTDQRDSS